MTVSQTYEILWEPDEPAEAVAGAIALLRVDGLELEPVRGSGHAARR